MRLSVAQIEKIRKRYKLTKREADLVKLYFAGINDNLEISKILNISFLTAKLHVTNIYRKLSVNHKLQVVIKIIDECKLLDFDIKGPPKGLISDIQKKYNFTDREIDLIKLIFQGITANKEIDKIMNISIYTNKTYLSSIYKKIQANNKLALIIKIID